MPGWNNALNKIKALHRLTESHTAPETPPASPDSSVTDATGTEVSSPQPNGGASNTTETNSFATATDTSSLLGTNTTVPTIDDPYARNARGESAFVRLRTGATTALPTPEAMSRPIEVTNTLRTKDGTWIPRSKLTAFLKKLHHKNQCSPEAEQICPALHDVPGQEQLGPTCGLNALRMVMRFYDEKNPALKAPYVSPENRANSSVNDGGTPDTEDTLLAIAKEKGYTKSGEMFYGENLAKLAQHFDYETTTLRVEDDNYDQFKDFVNSCIERGHPVLAPFDVDYSGNPTNKNGSRAHWTVIEGFQQYKGRDVVIANHAWDGNKTRVWWADEFFASMNQLNESTFDGVLPEDDDISKTLKNYLIEVIPQAPDTSAI